jgi:PKD domain
LIKMRRYSLTTKKLILAAVATLVASLGVATTAAQAVVVKDGGTDYGVALVPGTNLPASYQIPSSSSCPDPSLAPDLHWQTTGMVSPLCYHSGSVLTGGNETYVLTWDPDRRYWATTRQYVEQFLSDVGASSGSLGSPYAVTPQYTEQDPHGTLTPAADRSLFAGGCIDYGNSPGNPSGYTCQFGADHPHSNGTDYPTNGCPKSGENVWDGEPNGPIATAPNDICLTDGQIQNELQNALPQMGLPGGNVPGYQPLVVVLTPPGVEVCLDSTGNVCSSNSDSNTGDPVHSDAQFCSYHSQISDGGVEIPYVVQPWTAQWGVGVACDDGDAPNITLPVDVKKLAQQVGAKLVSPLSQGQLAAIVNPGMQGWYGEDGAEINDNGCIPLSGGLDHVTLNGTTYALQREFNNAGAIETDPTALPCTDWVDLTPAFVVPGPVWGGDNVLFDGSVTASTLMIHNGNYSWSFGDGTTASGPSVYHQYAKGGKYNVTLTVRDRGGNTASITQTVTVLGDNGQPVPSDSTPVTPGTPGVGALKVHLQLLPQSLKSVLHRGIAVRVSSNHPANGIATVWLTRAAARRAHIKTGKGPSVRIGIGTVSSITNGTVTLRLHLSRAMIKKLHHVRHVTMTVRLALVGSGTQRLSIVAAGRY